MPLPTEARHFADLNATATEADTHLLALQQGSPPAGGGSPTPTRKWTLAAAKAFFKTYFDTLYVALTGNQTIAGTKTFSAPLVLPAGSASAPAIAPTGDANTGLFFPSADVAAVATGGAERARVHSNGQVSIGTTSNNGGRLILDDAGPCEVTLRTPGGAGNNARARLVAGYQAGGSGFGGYFAIHTTSSANANVERIRINYDGFFKASSTGSYFEAPTSSYHEFLSTTNAPTVVVSNTAVGSSTRGVVSKFAASATGRHFSADTNGTDVFRVEANGNVTNTNNSYGAISDINLKQNIEDATPKLEDLNALRVVNYELKSQPGVKLIGLIAQEVEQVFPGLVDESPDIDPETHEPTGEVTKSVKYSVLVPMLVKAVQELTARIETLESA